MSEIVITLKPQSDEFAHRHHPWVFSGAIGAVAGDPVAGDTVLVRSVDGTVWGRGAWSPRSQMMVRLWTFEPEEAIDEAFFRRRIEQAAALRSSLAAQIDSDAYRVVNAEADGLPGIIVDRYGDALVCQFLSTGAERWKSVVVRELGAVFSPASIYERSDTDSRAREGLDPAEGLLAGREPPERIVIREGTVRYEVDVRHGHKTGFYLDQRENRRHVAAAAAGRDVLNVFAYTGAFGVAALAAGAHHVTNVESSAAALEGARAHVALNALPEEKVEYIEGDAFNVLRQFRDSRRQFDLIVLDPPRFAASRRQLEGACRGYKDINLLAFKLLRKGGLLATFSCSEHMESDLFQKVVADAALDAHRPARILRWFSQASDHPVALNVPEGRYLKGLLCRVE
jgi:23S rRNA (cytosine1962-C5)-methyltransferase